MEQGFSIADLLGVLRRRWPLLVVPTILCTMLALGVALILPPVYSSTARILVESQQIPGDLARSTVTAGPTERIRLIEQRLMTRQNLLDLAARFSIFGDRPDLTPSEIVDLMREKSAIEDIVLAVQNRTEVTATAVNITFKAQRPDLAARVANEFVSQVLQLNISERNARASETLRFFNGEVDRLSREIGALDERISTFKRENEGALPASLAFRQSEFAGLQERMFEREGRKVALEQNLLSLRDRLASGDISVGMSPEEQELQRLRQALTQQRAIYAESHPSVRSLTARIAGIEQAIAPQTLSDADPAGRGAVRALQEIEFLDKQLELINQQLATDEARRIALEDSIQRTPNVEIALAAFERAMDNLQEQYKQMLLKQADAATGERLEVNRQAERFEVIEQAQAPQRPDSPNRPLIVAAGLVGGGGLGFALILLFEIMNRSLWNARDLERQVGLRPIVSVPYIFTDAEISRRKWKIRIIGFAIVVIVPMTLYAIDQFYRPLPLILERISQLTGLDGLIAIIESRFGG